MSLVHHVLDKVRWHKIWILDNSWQFHSLQDDFDTQIKEAGGKLVLVDFYAQWCGPCKLISPELDQLSKTFSDIIFMKVDVDQIEELASEFEISSMPTIIAFLEGEKVINLSSKLIEIPVPWGSINPDSIEMLTVNVTLDFQ